MEDKGILFRATGEAIMIPAKEVLEFRVAQAVKDAVVAGTEQDNLSGSVSAKAEVSSATLSVALWHKVDFIR